MFGELPPQFCVLPSLLQDAFSAACLNGSLKPDSITKSVLKQKFHATSEGVKEMSQRSPINLVKSYIHFIRGPRILERDLNSQLLRAVSYVLPGLTCCLTPSACSFHPSNRMGSNKRADLKHQNVAIKFAVYCLLSTCYHQGDVGGLWGRKVLVVEFLAFMHLFKGIFPSFPSNIP